MCRQAERLPTVESEEVAATMDCSCLRSAATKRLLIDWKANTHKPSNTALKRAVLWVCLIGMTHTSASSQARPDADAVPTAISVYIDNERGNDSNPGTALLPWRSLQNLSNRRITSGTRVRLACGQTWREPLVLDLTAGAKDVSLTGTGDDCAGSPPVISGADLFNGQWVRQGSVWSRPLRAGTPKITQLRINATSLRTAQWPNHTPDWNDYATLSAAHRPSSLELMIKPADTAFLAAQDIKGATLMVKSKPWFQDTLVVDGLDTDRAILQLRSKTRYQVEAESGYLFTDKRWMLDAPGEFFHDSANARLWLIPPTELQALSLNAANVSGSTRDVAMTVKGGARLLVTGITLEMARRTGLRLEGTAAPHINRLCVRQNGEDGVYLSGTVGGQISSSMLTGNARTGIEATDTRDLSITENVVQDTGLGAHMVWSAGAIVAGDQGTTSRNTILGAAYHGIRYAATGATTVSDNTITGACTRFSDCGAIYTWNGPIRNADTLRETTTVKSNRINRLRANKFGAVGEGADTVAGIYLDDFSRDQAITDNQVTDVPIGLFIHNGSYLRILNNRLWHTSKASILMIGWRPEGDYLRANTLEGNDLAPHYPASLDAKDPTAGRENSNLAISFHHNSRGSRALGADANTFRNSIVRLPKIWRGKIAIVKSNQEQRMFDSLEVTRIDPSLQTIESNSFPPTGERLYSVNEKYKTLCPIQR